jgi:hypothetical protein
MSYTEKAKQNKINADKAAAYDQLARAQQEQQVYRQGSNDAYSAVEREMMRKAEQDLMDKRMAEAAAKYAPVNTSTSFGDFLKGVNATLKEKTSAIFGGSPGGLADTVRAPSQYDAQGAAVKKDMEDAALNNAIQNATASGDRSEDNINRLLEIELNKLMVGK